jgi:APA family basic amino acid/polyamine antiporter
MRPEATLARVVGVPGAVLMGLGSILGTGVFVSIGIASGVSGASVLLAIALAAIVATFNGLSSAELAANHPVSGGTYEYGYRYLTPSLGFTAGWMFLCAKTASAATAALGLAGYVLNAFDASRPPHRVGLALVAVILLTLVVAGGLRRANWVNATVVSVTLFALVAFVVFGLSSLPASISPRSFDVLPSTSTGWKGLLHATALMFVAYTGYGRIATLGEEIRDPRRNIPRAIVLALLVSMALYLGVGVVAIGTVGADGLGRATSLAAAPLQVVANRFTVPQIAWVVAVGAVTAMLGVLLNLLLGLSRVLLAMSRRSDAPTWLSKLEGRDPSPRRAVLVTGALIVGLVLTGNVKTTWSFSAFTVLVYYALTNLAAIRLAPEDRLYPGWTAWAGLASCLGLAFWVEPSVWMSGLILLLVGLGWHHSRRRWLRTTVRSEGGTP